MDVKRSKEFNRCRQGVFDILKDKITLPVEGMVSSTNINVTYNTPPLKPNIQKWSPL